MVKIKVILFNSKFESNTSNLLTKFLLIIETKESIKFHKH